MFNCQPAAGSYFGFLVRKNQNNPLPLKSRDKWFTSKAGLASDCPSTGLAADCGVRAGSLLAGSHVSWEQKAWEPSKGIGHRTW